MPRARILSLMSVTLTLALALANGCQSKSSETTRELTAHERDSVLATERALPGSTVVGRALDVTDASRARADSINAQVDALPR